MVIKSVHRGGELKLKRSITKKLVMTYSAVLGVFLVITLLFLYITARRSLEKTLIHNLNTESAIIEELYRERMAKITEGQDQEQSVEMMRGAIRSWFSDIKKLAGIGFASDFALVLRTDNNKFGIFTPGDSPNEVDFKSIQPEDLSEKLQPQSYFFTISGLHTSYFAVSRPLSDRENLSLKAWIIAYSPVHELNKLVRDLSLQGAFALGAGLLVAAFLSYYLSLNISKPIKALKGHAEKIASRDFSSRVTIGTGDEIESLAQAMNKIAGDLKSYDLSQKRFLQNVSHELKTPVMSIMGYAEGLRDEVIEDRDKALHVIISECERLQRLVSEVLYLSKLETVEEFYSFKREKLNAVLDEIRDKIQPLMDQWGIRFELRLDKDCMLNMDRDKLMQAILNLLSNALRYSKGLIVLETQTSGKTLVLRVWDNGEGMNEKELQQVFERFYKGRKGSTGLGMTITKAIIEKHRGSITADNHPEGGAVFTIRLPITTAFSL